MIEKNTHWCKSKTKMQYSVIILDSFKTRRIQCQKKQYRASYDKSMYKYLVFLSVSVAI